MRRFRQLSDMMPGAEEEDMRIKKITAWAGGKFAKLRLLFMLHFMFDRVVRAENMKWQQMRNKEK